MPVHLPFRQVLTETKLKIQDKRKTNRKADGEWKKNTEGQEIFLRSKEEEGRLGGNVSSPE